MRASTASASCRSRPTRSTATSSRRLVDGGRPAAPLEPVLRVEGGRRPAGARLRSHVRGRRAVTRGSNTYGPRQYPEKLLPLFVTNALDGQPLPVYGDGRQVRDWLHVDDHCAGIELVLREGEAGRGLQRRRRQERENIDVTQRILDLTGARPVLVRHVEDRPGHDRRYAVDSSKLRALGWSPQHSFDAAARGDGRVVPRQPRLVGADQVGRLP